MSNGPLLLSYFNQLKKSIQTIQIIEVRRFAQLGREKIVFYDIFILLCERRGVTPARFSADTGIAQSTISMWKKNGATPSSDKLAAVAKYFDVSVDYLLTGDAPSELTALRDTSPDTMDITEDDFTYAMFNEGKTLTPEKKQALLQMAKLFNEDLKKEEEKE